MTLNRKNQMSQTQTPDVSKCSCYQPSVFTIKNVIALQQWQRSLHYNTNNVWVKDRIIYKPSISRYKNVKTSAIVIIPAKIFAETARTVNCLRKALAQECLFLPIDLHSRYLSITHTRAHTY